MVLQTADKNGWFWYIPLHDDIVSVGVVAPFDYLFKGRGRLTSRPITRKSIAARRSSSGSRGATRVDRLLRDAGLLVPVDAGRGRRLGAGRRCVRVPRSAVFLRRAAGAEVGRAGRGCDRRGAGRTGDTSARQLGKWGPAFNEGVDRMRRLVCEFYDGFSFGRFVRSVSRAARDRHRSADRRSLHRSRGRGVAGRWSHSTRPGSGRSRHGTPRSRTRCPRAARRT